MQKHSQIWLQFVTLLYFSILVNVIIHSKIISDTLALEDSIYQNACVLEKAHINDLNEVTTLYDRGSSVNNLEHSKFIFHSFVSINIKIKSIV